MTSLPPKPLILCVLDGWGYANGSDGNAIALAHTPNWDKWCQTYPMALLDTSGESVGLPPGQMGNSEVGHMTIGAGRVIWQDLPQISQSISSKNFFRKEPFLNMINSLKKSGRTCHLMGLLSPGGIHSHQDHLFACIQFLGAHNIKVQIHAFLDGRDTSPTSAISYLEALKTVMAPYSSVILATAMGRYYAMDRDNRWERSQKAWNAIVNGQSEKKFGSSEALEDAIKIFYTQDITDEFIPPLIDKDYVGMDDGDVIFMTNFRSDRVRQILRSLILPKFDHFPRNRIPNFSSKIGMTSYASDLEKEMTPLFPPKFPKNTLGDVLSQAHLKQLRIAETEKYAHVTFFFNGGQEKTLAGEERLMIPSSKVATYDLCPEMSATEITDHIVHAIKDQKFDVIIVNYANADMVGHSGKIVPTIKAIETLDKCLGRLNKALEQVEGILLITADHGNAEMMIDPTTHKCHTAHSTNPVPFIIVGQQHLRMAKSGSLQDVAPTVLKILHLPVPEEMTGHSLV